MSCKPFRVGDRDDIAGHAAETLAVGRDDVHPAHEVLDAEHARVAGRAERGKGVARTGDVVTERSRCVRTEEDGAGVAHERDHRPGILAAQLQVLGRDLVRDLHGLGRSVYEHRVAAATKGRLISARLGEDSTERDGLGHGIRDRL